MSITRITGIRAVIDTSVLVKQRSRIEIQEAAARRLFVPIWSPWVIAELNRVLTWRWIKDRPPGNDLSDANERRCGDAAKRMMEALFPVFELVHPLPPYPAVWQTLTDLWDVPIFAAAIAGNAQYVVSDNTRDYPPEGRDGRRAYSGVEYLSGEAFLAVLYTV